MTRQDLRAGYQAVQSCHAIPEFAKEHPETYKRWDDNSKTIALLSVPNEHHLQHLVKDLAQKGIRYSIFNEPDIDNQMTAVAIEPHQEAYKLCASFPLALREFKTIKNNNHNDFQSKAFAA